MKILRASSKQSIEFIWETFLSFLVEYTASTIFSLISTGFLGNVFLAN